MAFPQTFVLRHDIPLAQGKNDGQKVLEMPFPLYLGFFFNHQNIHLFTPGFFIYFIQITAFICFVQNLRTSLRIIYRHVPPGINGYFGI